MMQQNKVKDKKPLFIILWLVCIIGSCSILPYVWSLGIVPSSFSFYKFLFVTILQSTFLFGVVSWLSYLLIPKTDLSPFSIKDPLKRIVYPGVISGVALGLIIYLLDKTLFQSSLLSGKDAPLWAGLLASIYGGVNEEVLLRLFLFTLVYFLFKKVFKFETHRRLWFLWIANIIVAILFGIGHMPAAFRLITPSSFEIFRILLLNGIAGLVFGWLYWSRGLWTAMSAHFMTDLLL